MTNVLYVAGTVRDFPWNTIVAGCRELIVSNKCDIFQKFSCSQCGQRLTMEEPNTLFTHGTCDRCGALTDIKKQGCNYRSVHPGDPSLLHQPRALTIKETDPARSSEEGAS